MQNYITNQAYKTHKITTIYSKQVKLEMNGIYKSLNFILFIFIALHYWITILLH